MSLPAWVTDPSSFVITEEQYEALPSEIARSIEVVDGRVIFCESPTRAHQRVVGNLFIALRDARPPDPCLEVVSEMDVRFDYTHSQATDEGRRFTFRRPDITVHRCLDLEARLTSSSVVTVIEVTSSNAQTDVIDKKGEYAAQRIPAYLIVVLAGTKVDSVEEYRLDWSGRNYQLAAIHREELDVELPEGVKLKIPLVELTQI
ncbi:Uma2 family endonuclease [Thermoactinospora rubra]|uniref:Uma2 family endonuclease n=1 Tax=Thermoactinospora rubra TaxID=1088767 RepID=UPI001F0B4E1B|nr:Uma2 family endonuclease [Thermoactinospora rubra]